MNIVSITWARNEADIIEAFVRYNSNVVHQMHIIDNDSNDQTWDILNKLKSDGLPLILYKDQSPYHRQAEALTELMHKITKQQAALPWIIPLDADEFLCTTMDPFHEVLEKCDPDTPYTIPWRTYVPTPSDNLLEHHPLRRIKYRRSEELIQFSKILIPSIFAQDLHIRITEGNHYIFTNYNGHEETIPAINMNGMFIAHFPIRSESQLRRKIIDGWQRHCANPRKKEQQAFHWEQLYPRCVSLTPINALELQTIACNYATSHDESRPIHIVYDPL